MDMKMMITMTVDPVSHQFILLKPLCLRNEKIN